METDRTNFSIPLLKKYALAKTLPQRIILLGNKVSNHPSKMDEPRLKKDDHREVLPTSVLPPGVQQQSIPQSSSFCSIGVWEQFALIYFVYFPLEDEVWLNILPLKSNLLKGSWVTFKLFPQSKQHTFFLKFIPPLSPHTARFWTQIVLVALPLSPPKVYHISGKNMV